MRELWDIYNDTPKELGFDQCEQIMVVIRSNAKEN